MFGDNQELFHAFLFNIVVVGTTCGKVSKSIQALGPDIPWRDVTDTRNRVVHAYWQVEAGLLSALTIEKLQALVDALDRLIVITECEGEA